MSYTDESTSLHSQFAKLCFAINQIISLAENTKNKQTSNIQQRKRRVHAPS